MTYLRFIYIHSIFKSKYCKNISGKPHPYETNITLGVTDTTGIDFSATFFAYPKPWFELEYENGTKNNMMMGRLSQNAVNIFTVHFNQTVVNPGDYGLYFLNVRNNFGSTKVYVNVLPQSKFLFFYFKKGRLLE